MSDELGPYREEWRVVVSRLIARAWLDAEFKAALVADPVPHLHAEGLLFPDRYEVEFYEDPGAAPGDWHSVGRGGRAVHRFAIPPVPERLRSDATRLDDDLAGLACCCPCASCTGAISQETWT